VPYKFGPFSFALYRDMDALVANGFLSPNAEQSTSLNLRGETKELARSEAEKLPKVAWPAIREVQSQFGSLDNDTLIRLVYSEHPWFAMNSERTDLLPSEVPVRDVAQTATYTVGYEGKCIDGFLAHLLRKGIQRIIDVRRNPVSRKYGFAKSTLTRLLAKVGIEYEHVPELGIPSEERAHLSDSASYHALLERYEHDFLPQKVGCVARIRELLHEKPSALLCMEADPSMCHRSRLAKRAASDGRLELQHL